MSRMTAFVCRSRPPKLTRPIPIGAHSKMVSKRASASICSRRASRSAAALTAEERMTASSSSVPRSSSVTASFVTLSEPTFRPSWSSGTLIRAGPVVLPTTACGNELVAVENVHRRTVGAGQLLGTFGDQERCSLELELGGGDLGLDLDDT